MGAFIDAVPSAETTRATADRVLRQLGTVRAKSDYELCLWLLCGHRLSVHRVHGHASFREYAEWVFGFSGRATEERLRTAAALEHLPRLSAVFDAGELLYSVVREVTRVATPETEEEWIAAVRNRRASDVERMVSGRERGDRPSDPIRPEAERHRVTLNLHGSTWALWLQAREAATRASGGTHVTDDELVTQLARVFLAHGTTAASPHVGATSTDRSYAAGPVGAVDEAGADTEARPHDYEVAVASSTHVSILRKAQSPEQPVGVGWG